nr:PREDICTED: eukaryotic translation initiation factor 2A-like isoform X3 [Nicotiana sylvestris]
MTATTAPRLQVDNGVKIFHHNGSLYFKKMFDRLYKVDWKPESVEKFGDIEDLVKAVGSVKIDEAKAPGKGSKATQAVPKATQAVPKATQAVPKATPANPPAAKPAAYRPPHAKVAAAVQAELFGGSSSGELSKNALKNKKKREKQREKKQTEGASGTGGS